MKDLVVICNGVAGITTALLVRKESDMNITILSLFDLKIIPKCEY